MISQLIVFKNCATLFKKIFLIFTIKLTVTTNRERLDHGLNATVLLFLGTTERKQDAI